MHSGAECQLTERELTARLELESWWVERWGDCRNRLERTSCTRQQQMILSRASLRPVSPIHISQATSTVYENELAGGSCDKSSTRTTCFLESDSICNYSLTRRMPVSGADGARGQDNIAQGRAAQGKARTFTYSAKSSMSGRCAANGVQTKIYVLLTDV